MISFFYHRKFDKTKDSIIEKNLNAIKFTFSELIKEARMYKNNRMSIRELSRLSGVSTAVISDLETCTNLPRIEILLKLCACLGIPFYKLFNIPELTTTTGVKPTKSNDLNKTLKIMGLNESNAKEVMEFIDFKLSLQNKK